LRLHHHQIRWASANERRDDDFARSLFALIINDSCRVCQASNIGPADQDQATMNRGRRAGDALAASELDKDDFAGMEAALVNYAA
jgi:hypothetical protein